MRATRRRADTTEKKEELVGCVVRWLGFAGSGRFWQKPRPGLPGRPARWRTACPAPDMVERDFTAPGPDRLWVADITYIASGRGSSFSRSFWMPGVAGPRI